ncbi:hypothetical protein RHA1_ro06568 [Rhodococcus jostii RHA1]|uniref:Uncharacterized protein n=1 Tax=Rhodococcus jostii (strain RHA1) TaxID=101510 RepID=Q0S295_RHOJR|nr:hypothetical protein RHA1_ro06568 [Rhodococcus jostii RHA1]
MVGLRRTHLVTTAGQRPAPRPQGLRPGRRNGSLADAVDAVGAGLEPGDGRAVLVGPDLGDRITRDPGYAVDALLDELDRSGCGPEHDTLGIRALNLAGDGYSYAAETVHNGVLRCVLDPQQVLAHLGGHSLCGGNSE